MDVIAEARNIFDIEIDALIKTRDYLNESFQKIVEEMATCKGKVILVGMGKSGHIARKIAATLSSLGTPAFNLHPAEALHGDLGMVTNKDIVIMISYSGESDEIINLLPNIKMIGAKIIAISGNKDSTLVGKSDQAYLLPQFDEACYMNLAPTSSTTAVLVLGDALAILLAKANGFNEENFALFHPSGLLGKRLLLKAEDVLIECSKSAIIKPSSPILDALTLVNNKKIGGLAVVINEDNEVVGVFSDGDLRRLLEKRSDIYNLKMSDVMQRKPICVRNNLMVVEILLELKNHKITVAPVIDDNGKLAGVVTMQNILDAGIKL